MDIRKRVSIAVLAMAMAVMFSVPAVSFAESELLDQSKHITEVKGAAQPANLEEEAEEAAVGEAYRMQDAIALFEAGKLHCENADITMEVNGSGNGLMITGTPEALNSAEIVVDGDFVLKENSVARFRLDAVAQVKTQVAADVYLGDGEDPVISCDKLPMQKGSKSWKWSGDSTVDVALQNIHGSAKSVSLVFRTDSTAKKVSVLLRGFEFMKADGLPTVYLNIDESIQTISAMNNDPNHETECYGDMTLRIPAGYQSEYGGEPFAEEVSMTYPMEYIRGRGNSTWVADKKPYKVKLEKKADLLNMGASKHWVLLANRYDNSLLRNKITYWMGDQLGMEFTPQCVFVDVVMNGEYLGSYYLCEQIRVGESRVEIDDLEKDGKKAQEAGDGIFATEEPQITGGYLLGMAPYDEDVKEHPEQMFQTTRGYSFEIESPEFEAHTEAAQKAQYDYIKGYVQKVEDAIYGSGFRDASGTSWEDYLDKQSAIDYYWFQEVSLNGDGFNSPSSYMYKKRDGKLYFGPLWDFDYVAWGDLEYENQNTEEFMQTGSLWYGRLFSDESFMNDLKARYPELSKVLKASLDQIDVYADELRVSDFYEREKWGTYTEGLLDESESEDRDVSFDEEVTLLKNWIKTRDEWVSANLDKLQGAEETVVFKDGKKVLGKVTLKTGAYLENIPDPGTKKGKVFAGWFQNYGGTLYPYYFSYPVMDSTELYAKWVDVAKEVKVQKLYFDTDRVSIYYWPGEGMEMTSIPCQIVPFNATQQMLSWSSSDPTILKIDPKTGAVTPNKEGTVKVTVTAANGKKAVTTVEIKEYPVDADYSLSLKKNFITLMEGEYGKVPIVQGGEPFPVDSIYYDCSNLDVLEMGTCGVFKALREGTAKITITNNNSDNEEPLVYTVHVKLKEKKGAAVTRNGLKYVITKVWTKKAKAGTVKVKGFSGASKKSLKIPASIKINGHTYKVTAVAAKAFKGNKVIQSATFGSNVKTIGANAFAGCKALRTVKFGGKLRTIGAKAFANCKALHAVTFGSKLRTIGAKAFYKSSKLKKVTFTGKTIKKIGKKAFKGIAKKAVITVPNKGKKVYKKKLKKSAGITKKMKIRVKKVSYKKLK